MRDKDVFCAVSLTMGHLLMHAQTPRARTHGPANKPGSLQHPLGENNGVAPQRVSDQGHLRCPAPPAVDSRQHQLGY